MELRLKLEQQIFTAIALAGSDGKVLCLNVHFPILLVDQCGILGTRYFLWGYLTMGWISGNGFIPFSKAKILIWFTNSVIPHHTSWTKVLKTKGQNTHSGLKKPL